METVRERLRTSPDPGTGPAATRWTLARIAQAFPTLGPTSTSGLWRWLRRHRIRLRRGRPQLFSPDPAYEERLALLLTCLEWVAHSHGRCVVLFLDEFTLSHWPLVARNWSSLPGPPPCARRAKPGERKTRLVGALDARSGRVLYRRANAISKDVFSVFLEQLAQVYPDAERIYVVLDNWPVHHSPEVAAMVQTLRRLELVFLPTYAPWLNPIEKLWDWLKDAVLRLHELAGKWKEVKREAEAFLDRFADGSTELLIRVGLHGDGRLAHPLTTDSPPQI